MKHDSVNSPMKSGRSGRKWLRTGSAIVSVTNDSPDTPTRQTACRRHADGSGTLETRVNAEVWRSGSHSGNVEKFVSPAEWEVN